MAVVKPSNPVKIYQYDPVTLFDIFLKITTAGLGLVGPIQSGWLTDIINCYIIDHQNGRKSITDILINSFVRPHLDNY